MARSKASPVELEERFWSRVSIGKINECWLYNGQIHKNGYGRFWLGAKKKEAHRAAFFFTHGYLPTNWILHSCDVRRCCNPAHLREGTPQENHNDMVSRGRDNYSTVTPEQVIAIRNRYIRGKKSNYRELAAEYEITRHHIYKILRKESWANV